MCKNDILVDEQYGFRSNISTEIASYKIINGILVAVSGVVYFMTWRKLLTV